MLNAIAKIAINKNKRLYTFIILNIYCDWAITILTFYRLKGFKHFINLVIFLINESYSMA